jgi:hypothetical protein
MSLNPLVSTLMMPAIPCGVVSQRQIEQFRDEGQAAQNTGALCGLRVS